MGKHKKKAEESDRDKLFGAWTGFVIVTFIMFILFWGSWWTFFPIFGTLSGAIKQTIEYRDNRKKCFYCGQTNKKDAKYCNSCGKELMKNCPECHNKINPDAEFCSACGHKIHNINEKLKDLEDTELKTETTISKMNPIESKCPQCGKENDPPSNFCYICGHKF